MKRSLTAAAAVFLSLNMAFSAVAATKLEAPIVRWNADMEAAPEWSRVEEAGGKYRLEAIRDDGWKFTSTHSTSVTSAPDFYKFLAFGNNLTDSGTYKFHVKALGDGIETLDSDWSEYSDEWTFTMPDISFGVPENPHWEGTSIVWNAPSDALSQEYAEYICYEVTVYGDEKFCIELTREPGPEVDVSEYMKEDAKEHTFEIRTISTKPSVIFHSELVYGDAYNTSGENANVAETIDNILNSENPEDLLAAPDKLAESRDKVQVAMQTDPDVAEKVAELEAAYMAENSVNVATRTSEDAAIDGDAIQIIGAGLNASAPDSTVTFHVSKPEREVMVDNTAYRNALQVDFSLEGASKQLKVPVQITLPIPDSINPKFFTVLHYHADGSFDELMPPKDIVLNGDGTATFTVTSFSTFVFAETGADLELIATPSNATEFQKVADALLDPENELAEEAMASGMAKIRDALLNDVVKAKNLDIDTVSGLDSIVSELAGFNDEFAVDDETDDELIDSVAGAHLLAYVEGKGEAASIAFSHYDLATSSNATEKLNFKLKAELTMKDGKTKSLTGTLHTPIQICIVTPDFYDEIHKSTNTLTGAVLNSGDPVDYENGVITFMTDRLGASVKVIGKKTASDDGTSDDKPSSGDDSADKPSGGSSSRRSGPRSGIVKESDLPKSPAGGSWKLADGMYSYYYSDGTRAENVWLEIGSVWYYFGKDGIMATGWLKDNGNYFYLDPATGAMATGWREIDGTWYYFNEAGNGFKGMMLADTVVDGYQLDESGAWVS